MTTFSFDEVLTDVSGGNLKTLQSEFQVSGVFPIVDQGKSLVAGYTDQRESLCKVKLPAIVFGDHTRALKFIDFPFCMGADGVKVLSVADHADPKFVYYYLCHSGVPEAGYSRHFKFLKQIIFHFPSLAEQRRIAAILDQAEALRTKRRLAMSQLNEFGKSTYLEMFGHPLHTRDWWRVELGSIGILDRGVSKHRPRNEPALLGGPHPLIQTGDIANCDGIIKSYTSTYSDRGLAQSKLWQAGTLCITIAANIGKTGILNFPACFPDSIVGFTGGPSVTVEYIQATLAFLQKTMEDAAPESAQKNINLQILRKLQVPLPALSLQRSFSKVVAAIRLERQMMESSLASATTLFASLQHRAFNGER